jgi:hypothetical protein
MKVRIFWNATQLLLVLLVAKTVDGEFNDTLTYGRNRTGKFLFDALFGLEAAFSDVEEVAPSNLVKSCDCGEYWLDKIRKKLVVEY